MSWHWRVMPYLKKIEWWFKNDIRNLVNFHPTSSPNSEILHFDWLLLSEAYKVLYEKEQKRYVSWQ